MNVRAAERGFHAGSFPLGGPFCQGGDGAASCEVRAHLAMLSGDFKLAEMHYLEQVGASSLLLPTPP